MSETVVIDSHAHIDDPRFDEDREEVIARAREAGVGTLVVVSAPDDYEELGRAPALAEGREGLYATAGVHPHDASRIEERWWPRIEELCRLDHVVAVGETGLDYHYDHSPREVQKRAFAEHIALARRVGKPVVCHVRDAHEDALRILREERAEEVGAVIHCFTGTPEDAAAYAALGCHVSFSGIVTFRGKKSDPIRAAVREVPADRLLVETDCPYLAPEPNRGKRNEPAYVVHTAEAVAREAGRSYEEICALTAANTRSFFSLT